MVRNLILGGMPRSGKTRLARRLARELQLSHVSLDCQVRALEKIFPQLLISNDCASYADMCDRLKPFLFEQLRWLGRYNIPFILDAYYLRPIDLPELEVEGGFGAVFLGYPEINPKEKFQQVRENETAFDWTKECSDEQILSDLTRFITSSTRMKNWCDDAKIPFVDVSFNWESQIDKAHKLLCGFVR